MEQPIYHQIAALPLRKRKGKKEILLITSRETKRWVIPKGWPMDGITDHQAAKIEAFEEAGVEGRISKVPLGHFEYHKRLKSGSTKHVRVMVYALSVTTLKRNWPEKEQRTRKWFNLDDAVFLVKEEGLKLVIAGV
jgi:8-oxo-dGTP pyrophosphatase MutT (NUDIX family)